ncbi:MAG: response regulator transcription factor [Chloroflexi bacterium]|nr:response regulator transcription factor [Chloroflexota bacterium]
MNANDQTLIRVVLADDHAMVRKGIRDFLSDESDISIVAEAADGDAALAAVRMHLPHVAVLDLQMPGRTGIDITRVIRAERLSVGILILTAYDDDPFVATALKAGANGYILKTASPDELVDAVRAVRQGRSALDPEILKKLIGRISGESSTPIEPLSDRELEVLRLAARGHTNKAIALNLGISDRTVQGHLGHIFAKLDVTSRTEAVTRAIRLGLISADAGDTG